MNTMPIDRTLKALEDIADSKGLKLEDVDGYVDLCKFLTDLEYNESPEWISKVEAFKTLERIVDYVAPGWAGHVWEFHARCQPEET